MTPASIEQSVFYGLSGFGILSIIFCILRPGHGKLITRDFTAPDGKQQPSLPTDPDNKIEETVRQIIRHENDLMNHRFTWLALLQGLLFAALKDALALGPTSIMPDVLCFVGVTSAFSAWVVLDAAHNAVDYWAQWWSKARPADWQPHLRPDVIGYRQPYSFFNLFSPWRILPVIFILSWGFVFHMHHTSSPAAPPKAPIPAATVP